LSTQQRKNTPPTHEKLFHRIASFIEKHAFSKALHHAPIRICAYRKKNAISWRLIKPMNQDKSMLNDKDHIAGLAKGLQVLSAFNSAYTRLTQSQAARLVGITPAAARRCLLTLCNQGFMATDGKYFWPDHGVLRLTYAYAAATRLPRLLQPALDALSERTRESASIAVLHGHHVLVAARSTAQRSLSVGLGVGSELPLHCSATGRVLLAAKTVAEREKMLRQSSLRQMTPHTETDVPRLKKILAECQLKGYGISNEEIELGVRSLAVPLLNSELQVVAALSISSRADRMTGKEMVSTLLPILLKTQAWAASRI
jgi:IclR family pca regulon transcriptional regulator